MITLVQRVRSASVSVDGQTVGAIGKGLLVFVGVERGDGLADAAETARKVAALRIFAGKHPMDLSVVEAGGACLVVSQFTLAGTLKKGNRPSFDTAESPETARVLYEEVARLLSDKGLHVERGRFAADMQVSLVNDGPVTFIVKVRHGQTHDVVAG